MSNLVDYITWRGDLPFSQVPFNDVDAMLFAQLSYYGFDGVVPDTWSESILMKDACAHDILNPLPNYCKKEDLEIQKLLQTSQRYANLELCGFQNRIDEVQEKQFCALTIRLDKNLYYVSFRGTDDSLIGWKENMKLSYNMKLASHDAALAYLKQVTKEMHGKMVIGGHSKGGNLAVYASAFSPQYVSKKIQQIYNFDGPGFNDQVIQKPEFTEIAPMIKTFVPQGSIIGMLLEHKEPYTIVKSSKSGFIQHIVHYWDVSKEGMVTTDSFSKSGEHHQEVLEEWINGLTYEEKEKFIEVVYELVHDSKTTEELFTPSGLMKFIKEYVSLDKTDKEEVSSVIGELKDSYFDNLKNRILRATIDKLPHRHR